jgi:hypothetical protein
MEHSQAIEMNASDRYVLGELSAADADAFEEHYFDCADCADDVRLGMTIMEGGRRLVRESAERSAPPAPVIPISSHPRWSKWIPAAAAAALVAIPINFALLMRMQNVVPQMASVAAAQASFRGAKRAATDPVPVLQLPKGKVGLLSVDVVLPEEPHARYEARVLRGEKRVETYDIPPTLFQDTLNINLPDPGPGTYDLVIVGIDPAGETPIVRHSFEVQR